MYKHTYLLVVIVAQFLAPITAQSQSYDLEYIYYKDSIDQVHSTELINVLLNLSEDDLTLVKQVVVEGINQGDGKVNRFRLTVDPDKGFQVSDSVVADIVDDYLHKDLTYDAAAASIRSYLDEPSLEIHPKMFVYQDDNKIKIQLSGYPSDEAMFSFDIQVEDTLGVSTSLDIGQVTTLIK